MDNLDNWYNQMVNLGQADIPMELGGRIITPRQYMRSLGRNV